MIETTKPATEPTMTDADWYALMDAAFWMDTQNLDSYHKKWIAIHGQQIIAAESDKRELYKQIDALGDSINQFRVLVRYIPGFDEL